MNTERDGLVIEPGKSFRYETIDTGDVAVLQAIVGGYLEVVPIDDEASLLVNEDGERLRLELNKQASQLVSRRIVGTAVLVGAADEDGNFTPVPERFRS